MSRKTTVDDLMDLDNFHVMVGGKEDGTDVSPWVNYWWPRYCGKRRWVGFNRVEKRFAESNSGVLGALVNKVLEEEGMRNG